MRLFFAALAALLLTLASASAQTFPSGTQQPSGEGDLARGVFAMGYGAGPAYLALPCGHPSVIYGCGITRRTAPAGGNVAVGTSATTVISTGAISAVARVSYQVQGTGYACVSWVTAAVTISANAASATCTGSGAYLVTVGSREIREGSAIPTTALTAIAASGAALVIVWDAQ